MDHKNTFGARVNEARKIKKMSQDSLAKMLGVSKQAISNWETNKNFPESEMLTNIALRLSVDVNWLLTGNGTEGQYATSSMHTGAGVKIFTLDEAADFIYKNASEDANRTRPAIPSYFPSSSNSFGIIIEDNSMSPEFIEGDIVIIDPDEKPIPGDKVCAFVDGMNKAVFRTYKSSGVISKSTQGKFSLTPINPNWSNIDVDNNGQILGVMVQHTKPRRQS